MRRHRSLTAAIAMLPAVIEIAAWTLPASATSVPTIYVANAGNPSSVVAIDSATGTVEKSIPILNRTAVSVGVAPNGKEAYAVVVGSDEVGSPGVLVPITISQRIECVRMFEPRAFFRCPGRI